MSRAIGAERRHLVEMFAFEGLTYDLLAAAIGAVLGVAVAWAMVLSWCAQSRLWASRSSRTFSAQTRRPTSSA